MKEEGQEKLRYEYSRYCEGAIDIQINDEYVIVACKKPDRKKDDLYHVSLFIKHLHVDTLNMIPEQSNVKFESEVTWINTKILKYVATLLSEGFFNQYVYNYEYMLACFDKGNEVFESEGKPDII